MDKRKIENVIAIFAVMEILLLFGSFLFGRNSIISVIVALNVFLIVGIVTIVCIRINKSGRFAKKRNKRICMISLLCGFAMSTALVAFAETKVDISVSGAFVDDTFLGLSNITVTAVSENSVEANGTGSVEIDGKLNKITAISNVHAYKDSNNCEKYSASQITVTLTNKNAGKVTIEFTSSNITGITSPLVLEANNGSATFTVECSEEEKDASTTGTFTVTGLTVEAAGATTYFSAGAGGSYSISDGVNDTYEVENSYTNQSSTRYTVSATPESGMVFLMWVDENGLKKSTENPYTFSAYEGTIKPVFGKIGTATYTVNGRSYGYLDEAITAAGSSGTIIVASDGTVYHSDGSTNSFVIPEYVTLLVPYDAAETTGVVNKTAETEDLPMNMYRKLILPSGCSVTVNGTLNINGQQGFFLAIMQGATVGDYGCLEMQSGSELIVNGELRVRGLIIGDEDTVDLENETAPIIVNGGGSVYQSFQVNDFRGGTYSSFNQLSKAFLINQFYIQNIQVGAKYASGSSLIGQWYLYADDSFSGEATVIGNTDNCLFKLNSGNLYMGYDESNSQSIVDIVGDISVQHISIYLKYGVGITMDTAKSQLPLFGGFQINVRNGATLDLNYAAKLLPGCVMTICDGATLNVNNALYLYDTADYLQGYGGYSYGYYRLRANSNSLTGGTVQRSSSNGPEALNMALLPETTVDGSLIVNGTVNINSGGALYTSTSAGANENYPLATTESTGRIVVNTATSSTTTITELNQSAESKPSISFNAAQGIYATTNQLGNIAGNTGTYKSTGSAWYNWIVTVKNTDEEIVATYYMMNGDKLSATEKYSTYYLDKEGTNEVTVGTEVTADMTLYVINPVQLVGRTIEYVDTINVICLFEFLGIEDFDSTNAGMVVWDSDPGEDFDTWCEAPDAYTANEPSEVITGLKQYPDNSNYYYAKASGITTPNLYKSAYYAGYVVADGEYLYSEVFEYSPSMYAYNMISGNTVSEVTQKTKNLCVALLNYISAAQQYFAYTDPNTTEVPGKDDLVNVRLTEPILQVDINGDGDLTDDLREFTWSTIKDTSSTIGNTDDVFERIGKNLYFTDTVNLAAMFKIRTGTTLTNSGTIFWTSDQWTRLGYSAEKMPTYTNHGGQEKILKDYSEIDSSQTDTWYSICPVSIAPKDMATTKIYSMGYVKDGETYKYSSVKAYGIEDYIANIVADNENATEASDPQGYYMCNLAKCLYEYEQAAQDALLNQ